MAAPGVYNIGLEQAVIEAGGITALAKKIGTAPQVIIDARRRGLSSRLILLLWFKARIKISRLMLEKIHCPHCHEEI